MNNMKLPPGVMPQDKADNIPAKLSPGEYVIPAEVVRRKGTEFFDKLVDSGKKDLNQAAQQGRIGGTPQMPQQQQRPAPQMKPMQQGQPKPPQMQQIQQRGPMAQMQQRPAPMTQQGQPQRLPMANGGFVAGPQTAHTAQAGNQAYHAGPQMGNYANGGQVNYPQGYNPYQNPGPYQFYPYQLGPQAWGGYPGPHVNPNFYDYTVRRNTQPDKKDEVEGKRASDLRPGETEDGKMVGTNTDYDVAIANMKNQGDPGKDSGANQSLSEMVDAGNVEGIEATANMNAVGEMIGNALGLGTIGRAAGPHVGMVGTRDKERAAQVMADIASGKISAKDIQDKQTAAALASFASLQDMGLSEGGAPVSGGPMGVSPNTAGGWNQTNPFTGNRESYNSKGELMVGQDVPDIETGMAGERDNSIGGSQNEAVGGTDTSQAENSQGGMGAAGSSGAGSAADQADAEGMGYKQGGLVVPPAVRAYKR